MYFTHSPQLAVCRYIPSTNVSSSQAVQASNPNLPKTIPALISSALSACDPDMRQVLLNNIVLTGGGSMLSGFADRLNAELQRNVSHVRPFPFFVYSPGCRPRNCRSKFTHRATQSNASTVDGWEAVFSLASARSTSCGSARKSGMCVYFLVSTLIFQILTRNVPGTRQGHRGAKV